MDGEFLKEWGYGEVRDEERMCMSIVWMKMIG